MLTFYHRDVELKCILVLMNMYHGVDKHVVNLLVLIVIFQPYVRRCRPTCRCAEPL